MSHIRIAKIDHGPLESKVFLVRTLSEADIKGRHYVISIYRIDGEATAFGMCQPFNIFLKCRPSRHSRSRKLSKTRQRSKNSFTSLSCPSIFDANMWIRCLLKLGKNSRSNFFTCTTER